MPVFRFSICCRSFLVLADDFGFAFCFCFASFALSEAFTMEAALPDLRQQWRSCDVCLLPRLWGMLSLFLRERFFPLRCWLPILLLTGFTIAVNPKTVNRQRWRCMQCSFCAKCGLSYQETKMVVCETVCCRSLLCWLLNLVCVQQCDQQYHIFCLRPQLKTVPSTGILVFFVSTNRV